MHFKGHVTHTLHTDLLYTFLLLDTALDNSIFHVSNPAMHTQRVIIAWKNSEFCLSSLG